jgi:hypothetical protein
MTKNDIIQAIRKTATENHGIALGMDKFFEQSGIKRTDWQGKYWTKWADAIIEAGFTPNQFSSPAYDLNWLLGQLAIYTRQLGHYPTQPELKIKNFNDKGFPTLTTIKNRLGNKSSALSQLINFCQSSESYADVLEICNSEKKNLTNIDSENKPSDEKLGIVYLMKSGKYYKIGKANHVGSRHYQIGIQLPERLSIVHEILTDDPFGIEQYWHNRFKDKRQNGEWFDLNIEDVSAFKRRKFM